MYEYWQIECLLVDCDCCCCCMSLFLFLCMQIWLLISAAVLALLLHYVPKVCESCLSSNDSASSTPSHSAHHCSSSAAVATDRLAKEGTGHQRERGMQAFRRQCCNSIAVGVQDGCSNCNGCCCDCHQLPMSPMRLGRRGKKERRKK